MRKRPIEPSELRVGFSRRIWAGRKHACSYGIFIYSAPLDAYRVDGDERYSPIMPLWEPVLPRLRKKYKEWLRATLEVSEELLATFGDGFPGAAGHRAQIAEIKTALGKRVKVDIPVPAQYGLFWQARTCDCCGKEFFCPMVRHRYRRCSRACDLRSPARQAAIKARVATISARRADARSGRACAYCSEVIEAARSTARFCSASCRVKAHYARAGSRKVATTTPYPQ